MLRNGLPISYDKTFLQDSNPVNGSASARKSYCHDYPLDEAGG